jgi:hypothetical protein
LQALAGAARGGRRRRARAPRRGDRRAGHAAEPRRGADLAIVEELLGPQGTSQTSAPKIDLDGATAYVAMDATKRCSGVYVVGTAAAGRALDSKAWPAERLLSQAVGKAAKLQQPKEPATTAQWYEGGYPVTARWRAGALVELRIGDAIP